MFGYVRAAREHLAPEDEARFKSAYCGLCHTLGREYGPAGRMVLNYDLTFLAMLLSCGGESCEKRCVVHPLKKRRCVCRDAAFDTAADMSIILVWWQLRDAIADHGFLRGIPYRVAALFLRRAYRKAACRQREFDEHTRRCLADLARLESENCPSMDAAADTFARLLQGAAGQVQDAQRRRVLEVLFYHLGRWVYLIDAADDLKKDLRCGSYNPLALRFCVNDGVLAGEDKETFCAALDSSVATMAAAFELLEPNDYRPIIESALYHGLYAVGSAVLDGSFRRVHLRKKGGHTDA